MTRIISTHIAARRLGISPATLGKHLAAGTVTADFESDGGKFFLPDTLPKALEQLQENRARNWRHLTPTT